MIPAFVKNGVKLEDARTYADLGCQENVTDPNCGDGPDTNGRTNAEELKDAKKNPDRYPDLLVRVGGYSALFTRLSPELQDAIIERVEQAI